MQPPAPAHSGRARRATQRFVGHRLAVVGIVFVAGIVAIAVMVPLLTSADPQRVDLNAVRQPPSMAHLLGTDQSGRDVWSRVQFGMRTSFLVGFGAVTLYISIGTLLGVLSGFFGGPIDYVVMRLTETFLSLPTLILVIVLASVVGPSLGAVIGMIGFLGWPATARLVRAMVLSLREAEFVTAARVIGATDRDIVTTHIVPNLVGTLLVLFTLGVGNAILLEASISFLGLGVQPPDPSLGVMVNEARSPRVLLELPWMWIPPALTIALTVLAVNFVGDGLHDSLDPRASGGE